MAKRSRRVPHSEPPAGSSAGATRRPAGAGAAAGRRTRSVRRARQETLFERYRSLLLGGFALIGVLIIGFLLFQSSARAGWTCETQLTPGPVESLTPRPSILATPTASASASPAASGSPSASASPAASGSPAASPPTSPAASETPAASESPAASPTSEPTPAPEPTARLGFSTNEMGKEHIGNPGTPLRYGFCPPTSGEHYNVSGQGPIRPDFYQPTEERSPGGWIHNLEHGYIVMLYRCPSPEDCPSAEELAQLRSFFDQAPDSGISACPKKVIVARFDSISTPYAMLAWNRALLMDEFNLDTAMTFTQQWMDHVATPERGACLA